MKDKLKDIMMNTKVTPLQDKVIGEWYAEAFANELIRNNVFVLPCKVGDTLYRVDTDIRLDYTVITPYTIDNIVICNDGDIIFKYDSYDGVICHLENIISDKPYLDYYRIFLNENDAKLFERNR